MGQEYKYVARISADTSDLEKVLNKAKGKLQRLNDDEVLIKLDYDGNVAAFNKTFNKMLKAAPELTIQFQYDVNKKILDQEMEKLQSLTNLKLDVENGNAPEKVKSMLTELNKAWSNDASESELYSRIDKIIRYANTAQGLGAKIDKTWIADLEEYADLGASIEKLLQSNAEKPLKLFDIDKSVDEAISTVQQRVEDFQKIMENLKKKGASELSETSEFQELSDQVKVLTADIAEMKQQLGNLSGEAFDEMTESVGRLEEKLKFALDRIQELREANINPNNMSLHVGLLGDDKFRWKSESMNRVIQNMNWGSYGVKEKGHVGLGFGILGTGVYHTPDVEELDMGGDNPKGYALNIDPSKYNLLIKKTNEDAKKLLKFLGDFQAFTVASGSDYREWDEALKGVDVDSLYKRFVDIFGETAMDVKSFSDFVDSMVAQVAEMNKFGFDKNGNFNIKGTKWDHADTPVTQLLKQMGYEGIDLRGTAFDNYNQGNTVFDLHPEDIIKTFDTREEMVEYWEKNQQAIKNFNTDAAKALGDAGESIEKLTKYVETLNEKLAMLESTVERLSKMDGVKDPTGDVTDETVDGIKEGQNSNSPSVEGENKADDLVDGYVNEINKRSDDARVAGRNLAEAAVGGLGETTEPELFVEDSGQLAFIDKLTDAEKELADSMAKVSDEAKESAEQIEGQLSLDFSKAAESQEKFKLVVVDINNELQRMAELVFRKDTGQTGESQLMERLQEDFKSAQKEQKEAAEANVDAQNEVQQETRKTAETTKEEAQAHRENAKTIKEEIAAKEKLGDGGGYYKDQKGLVGDDVWGYTERIGLAQESLVNISHDKNGNMIVNETIKTDYKKLTDEILKTEKAIVLLDSAIQDMDRHEIDTTPSQENLATLRKYLELLDAELLTYYKTPAYMPGSNQEQIFQNVRDEKRLYEEREQAQRRIIALGKEQAKQAESAKKFETSQQTLSMQLDDVADSIKDSSELTTQFSQRVLELRNQLSQVSDSNGLEYVRQQIKKLTDEFDESLKEIDENSRKKKNESNKVATNMAKAEPGQQALYDEWTTLDETISDDFYLITKFGKRLGELKELIKQIDSPDALKYVRKAFKEFKNEVEAENKAMTDNAKKQAEAQTAALEAAKKKAYDERVDSYTKIFYNGTGKLNKVEFAPNTEALQNSNALYDELEITVKKVYDLKEESAKLDKDTLVGQDAIAEKEKEIETLTERIKNILLELNAAEAVQEDRERILLELDNERDGVLQSIIHNQELQSRDTMSSQVATWIEQIDKLQHAGKHTQRFRERLEEARIALENFDSSQGSIDEVNAAFERLSETMKEINSDKGLSDFKKAQESSIAKLNLQIEEFMRKNTRMGSEFQTKFANLKIKWDAEQSLDEVQKLVAEFAKLKSEVSAAGKTGLSFFDTLRQRAMGVNAQLIAQYLSWQDLLRYIREAVNVIKELDYELVDLKKTTTMSTDELKQFYFAANDTAKEMGVTTKEIIAQAAAWSRLGYSSKEAATEMAALSSQFAQISPGMDVETATDGLVSTMKAFHTDVADVESEIMDVINKTGNTMATTNEEIVEMLKRSSAAMSAANNSIKETIALESAAVQITRNAENTGTAFRTISMRLRGYDEETDEYIGGIEELTGKVADLTKTASNSKGISLFTDETKSTYKSTYQILKDISEVYDDLSDKQQAELLETLAGKRGGQVLAGILGKENFKEVERAMENMKNAAGSADAEMSIVEESIDYKINKLEQTWEGIIQELIDNGMLGRFIDALTAISEVLGDIITTIGPFPTLIAGLGLRELLLNIDKIPEGIELIDTLLSGTESSFDHLAGIGQIFNEVSEGAKGAEHSVGSYAETLSNAGQIFHDISENAEAVSDVLDITDDISDMSEETQDVLGNISELKDTFGEVSDTAEDVQEKMGEIGEAGVLSADGLKAAFKGLIPILTNPITIMAALAVATYALYKWIDGANDRQRKKIAQLNKEYKTLDDQLSRTNSELANVQNQIDELQSKGPLSLVEKQELDRLRTQAELLRIAKREQEELLKLKAQELTDENTKHFNKVYGSINETDILNPEERLKGYEYKIGDISFSYSENLSSAAELASKGNYNDNPNELLAIYNQITKARAAAYDIEKKYGNLSRELNEEEQEALDNAKLVIQDTDQYMSGLEIQIGKVKTELLTMKQNAERAGTDADKKLLDALKLVYQYSGTSNEWNAKEIDSIFDNEKLEVTRSELEALAAAGELKESVLDQYPVLREEIESLDLILEDGETAWSLFKNEMKATGTVASEVANSIGEVDEALSSMQAISKLNDLESAINDVGTAMANIDEHGKFQLGDLDKIADYFIAYEEALKDGSKTVAYESKEVSAALKLLGEGSGDVKANADAINTLVDNYIRTSNVLKGLTEDNKELYETRLRMMGILNAETIVEEALAAVKAKDIDATLVQKISTEQLAEMKDALQAEDQETVKQITEVINAMLDEASANDNTRKAVEYLIRVQEIFSNQDLSVNDKISQLEKLANAYLETAGAAELTSKIQALQESKKYLRGAGMTAEIKAAEEAKIDAEIQRLMNEGVSSLLNFEKAKYTRAEYSGGTPLKNKLGKEYGSTESALAEATKKAAEDAAKAAYDAEHAYKQVIDYFERMVKVIDNSINLLEAHLEDVVGSFAKNTLLNAEEDLIQSKLNSYSSAVDMYSRKAEEALSKIPSDIADKLINGAVDIDEFISQSDQEVVDAIQDYQNWADKVADARLQLVQLKESLRQLELKKFQNVMKDFTDQFDLRQSSGIDLISKQIELLQEAGELVGESYYSRQREQTEKQLSLLKSEQEALVNQMNEALSRGVDKGSDEWLEMVNALTEVEGKILDAKKAIESFDNAILALHTEIFNRIQDQFSSYASELSNMEALFDDESMPVADENGEWTKEGLTRLGLLAQQYELAQEQTRMYGDEIEKLNQDYLEGKYSATEYADRLAELKEQQWASVNAAEAARKSMIALNKTRVEIQIEGINKEVEAYEKLIQAEKDALSAEKDLHDYQKSIADSEKSIVALQKQLAAIANDNSAAARAKRLKLQEQLNEKLEELEEKQYDHSVEQQQESLDEQLEQYKENRELEIEKLKESLLEIETLLNESFEAVRENSALIGEEIITKAREHGIEMSSCLTDAWFQGENAISHYSDTLDSGTSNFIANLRDVESNIWEMQDQANLASEDLADMFATRADNLVEELSRSFMEESNLDAMTNALHNSLSSTID